ncbi:hypothetical protein [Konateibacter massiliensis]|uniref:hypothetical protein n=1 Tax=Konateibacter massiliensis TaxID=2002841 RepID=UPI000C1582B2|nr:hypothetical protein [Konateibacter massiliensis]
MEGKNKRSYIGYEYKELLTDSSMVSMYIDGYRSFGWEPDSNQSPPKEVGKTIIRLKRDRRIMNRAELTRLQRNFEDCVKQIDKLENSKTSKATAAAISIGVAGTMFMTGAVFAVTATPPIIWLCVLLAIPGFAGWILPYFCFVSMLRKREEVVTPLVEDKYDEIYEICEKGNRLLGNE